MAKKRRSIHLDEPQCAKLQEIADRKQITVSELLRRMIDRYLDEQEGS